MERSGYYQCTFSFRNGTGYGVFTPDAQLAGGLPGLAGGGGGGGAGGQIAFYERGNLYTDNSFDTQRNANRSVFYYKGVTYVGSCFGMPDIEQRTINGMCNASSDDRTTTSQISQGGGGQNLGQNTPTIVQNNTGFVLNLGWEGKITRTRPTLRFKGAGEISVLSPTGNASITNLAFQAYQGLIGAIIQSTSNQQNAPGAPVQFGSAQAAINAALNDLQARVTQGSGTDPTYDEADVVPLKVVGSRRFF